MFSPRTLSIDITILNCEKAGTLRFILDTKEEIHFVDLLSKYLQWKLDNI